MKLLYYILSVSLFNCVVANAETTWVDETIQAEIQQETGKAKAQKGSQNIYILNKNDSEAKAKNLNNAELTAQQKAEALAAAEAQNQPETIVEASPLVESYATNLRKMRQNAEIETEQKIVEKLESARLEDERRRAQRLFGDRKFETPAAKKNPNSDVVTCDGGNGCWTPVEQAPVQIIEHAPVKTVEIVREKTVAPETVVVPTVKYENKVPAKKDLTSKSYVSAAIGAMDYKAVNVESKYALQLGAGIDLSSKTSVEAFFAYSQHRIDYFGYTDLNQYNWGVEGRYNLVSHAKFNVNAGAHLGLVFRNYLGLNKSSRSFNNKSSNSDESTRSVNVAPVVGAEFKVTKNFSLGLDYKYMINVAQSFSSDEMGDSYSDGRFTYEPLEDINYSVFSVKAKVRF